MRIAVLLRDRCQFKKCNREEQKPHGIETMTTVLFSNKDAAFMLGQIDYFLKKRKRPLPRQTDTFLGLIREVIGTGRDLTESQSAELNELYYRITEPRRLKW